MDAASRGSDTNCCINIFFYNLVFALQFELIIYFCEATYTIAQANNMSGSALIGRVLLSLHRTGPDFSKHLLSAILWDDRRHALEWEVRSVLLLSSWMWLASVPGQSSTISCSQPQLSKKHFFPSVNGLSVSHCRWRYSAVLPADPYLKANGYKCYKHIFAWPLSFTVGPFIVGTVA